MIYQKELKQKYEADVFVAGGGPSGVAAALAAARCGKSVFLAESQGCFGGAATVGLVPSFAPFDDGVNVLAAGIGYEIRKMVSKDFPLNTYWTPIRVEELKLAYDEIMEKSSVKYSFFTTVCDTIVKGDRIDSVVLFAKSGLFTVKAKIYIDCTGDADMCAFGGAEFEMGDSNGTVMPSTVCSIWANVDFDKRRMNQESMLEKAIEDGVFSVPDRHLSGMFSTTRAGGICGGNIGHSFAVDPTDETSLTKGMITGRRILPEYERYYKEYLDAYKDMTLVYTGSVLGVRE